MATTGTQVGLSWSFSGSKDSFAIDRRAAGDYVTIGSSASTFYTDSTASPNTAYLYRIRAIKSGTSSTASAADLATTVLFVDAPLVVGQTVIKAQHVTGLRMAINAVRATAGLPQSNFTDTSLAGVGMKTVHIQELRTALDQARTALLLSGLSYTDHPLGAGMFVKRMHLEELRGGVQ